MKNKIVFLKFNNYINKNLSDYLLDKTEINPSKTIEYLKNNFNKDEVIPTILNIIENDIESKNLITYLDLINYYISIVSQEKIIFFKKLVLEKLESILTLVSKPESRSIIYQFMIDYSELYDFDIKIIKKKFPIDKDVFLKKVIELATTKSYLTFLLMYEVSIFFNKNELNNMWLILNTLSEKEKQLFFKIFYNSFNEKNQKKIFKFLATLDKNKILSFVPTLNLFSKDKELYFKNILSLTSNEFNDFNRQQIKNGLFSQSQIFFSPQEQKMIFISDFFEYKKYSLIIEVNFNLEYINSKIIKQPILFNRSFFLKNYKEDFNFNIKINPIISKEIFKGIFFNLNISDLPLPLIMINYFTFKNTLKADKYKFIVEKKIKINDFFVGKNTFNQIINNNLHRFIDIDKFIPQNISHKKSDIKFFLETPIYKIKFDTYINENKKEILNSIKMFAELAKSLNNKKDIINFFILLYRAINNTENNFINIPHLKHLILFYLASKDENIN